MVASFSSCLGYAHLAVLLESFASRILFGAPQELLELVRLHPLLQQSQRARQLYALGFRSPADIARSDPRTLSKRLRQLVPFEATSAGHPMASTALATGCVSTWAFEGRALTELEAAQILVDAAREHIQKAFGPLGVLSIITYFN